jgi:fatty-acyl-CoA synthase
MHPTSDWLATWSRFRPEAEAIVDVATNRRWSYSRFHQESLAWAHRLHRLGVGPGDRIAVLALNRAETLALVFAAAELGAILAPLNWRLSDAELLWQLNHCTPKVCLHDPFNAGRLPNSLDLSEGPGASPDFSSPGSTLADPWILMYTSGTSGKPKGALLTHQQLHWNALNTILACNLSSNDSTLTFTPLFHTGGLNCLTLPLLHRGGRVVLCDKLEPGESLKLIQEEKITQLMGVPTIYQMLADHPDFEKTSLSSIQDALCGGAPLSLPLLQRYQARGIPLRQGFGLTEVGPNCFSTPPERVLEKLGSVGMPIHHIKATLLRPDGGECGPDEDGELVLDGPVVFGGYWANPEATAAAFCSYGFKTGDVLRRDTDGFFYVRGRIKEMYKSGGENVYPAEVEAAILQVEGVAHAAVIGVPDEKWGEVGRAFIELIPGSTQTEAGILAALNSKLARFKLPKSIILLNTLPRIGSGKIDKQLLKEFLK